MEATFEENVLARLDRVADALVEHNGLMREMFEFEKERALKAEAAAAQVQSFFRTAAGQGPPGMTQPPAGGLLPETESHRRPRRPQH